jgi:hypothetical protein
MSVETIFGDSINEQEIQKSNIAQYAIEVMEIACGMLHHGDRAIFYIPNRFSKYCLNNLKWGQYQGIVVSRVIFKPSLAYLSDFSRIDMDVACLVFGAKWMGVKLGGNDSWSKEVYHGRSKDIIANIGWRFSELDPSIDNPKKCIVEAGTFRNAYHSIKVEADLNNRSVQYFEDVYTDR